MRRPASICGLLMAWCLTTGANEITNHPAAEIISFRSANASLQGYLFKPATAGRHPAIIWNHGSPVPLAQSGSVERFDALAQFFLEHNFVLFIPDRRARLITFVDATADANDHESVAAARALVKGQLEQSHGDFRAAVGWLRTQSFVDANRIAAGGYSSGATQAMYEAAVSSDVRGYVLFTPGGKQWGQSPFMRELLLNSAKTSKAPMFVAEAQNDYQLQGIAAIGQELAKKGKPNATIVYPPHGKSQKDANILALTGVSVWSADVSDFLTDIMKVD